MVAENGFRITNRDVYEEVVRAREDIAILSEAVVTERGRITGLVTQVRLLWTLSFSLVAALAAAGVKVLGS